MMQLNLKAPNLCISRLSTKTGFSMSMRQMKRAEVSGWKHYKTVNFLKSHKRESVVEFFWDFSGGKIRPTVKGPNAKRESTDFPTNLRECAMLILSLHSHCYIGGLGIRFPFLLCTEVAIVPSQQQGGSQATCSPPTVLAFTRAKSRSLRGCVRFWSHRTWDVYRKLWLILIKHLFAGYCVKYLWNIFLSKPFWQLYGTLFSSVLDRWRKETWPMSHT